MKTIYTFPLSLTRSVTLELPVPIEKLGKRDKKKLFKWVMECVTAQANANRIEQFGRYKALLEEAEKIRKEWDFDHSDNKEKERDL